MNPSQVKDIVCAHSPDSDDAFMFYGLATKKIRSRLLQFRHVLEDIESLNRKAVEAALSGEPSRSLVNPAEIFRHLNTELWARHWSCA